MSAQSEGGQLIATHNSLSEVNWPTADGMVPLIRFRDKFLSRKRRSEEIGRRSHLTPTHSSVSAVNWPMDEEIVPFSLLDDKSLLNIENDKKKKKIKNMRKTEEKSSNSRSTHKRVTKPPTQVSLDAVQFEESEKRGQIVVLQPTNKKNNNEKFGSVTTNEPRESKTSISAACWFEASGCAFNVMRKDAAMQTITNEIILESWEPGFTPSWTWAVVPITFNIQFYSPYILEFYNL
jgi:hypothetical protein